VLRVTGGADVLRSKQRVVRTVACLAVVFLLAGCVPIGVRVQNMFALG
jgi:hypothetical protein